MKRRWFQIHLSTAVLLVFVSAGLIWLNMPREHEATHRELSELPRSDLTLGPIRYWTIRNLGWPFHFQRETIGTTNHGTINGGGFFIIWRAVTDLIVSFIFIFAAAFISETFLFRRETRNP